MPNLARQIGEPQRAVQLRQATVTAAPTGGTTTVRFGTGATAIAGVRHLSSAGIVNGDTVWVLQQGYDLLVIGKVGATEPLQFPNTVTDNKINLYDNSYSLGVRSHTFLLRTGGTSGSSVFLFEKADGTALVRINPNGLLTAGAALDGAYIGEHPIHTLYAAFGHVGFTGSTTGYCLLQNSAGTSILNAETGQTLSLRVGGSTKMNLAADITSLDEHYFDSWVRSNTSGRGWYHQLHGGGWMMDDALGPKSYGSKPVFAGNAIFGQWPGNSNYSLFTHPSIWGTTASGFLVFNNRDTWADCGGTNGFKITHHGAADSVRFRRIGGWTEIITPSWLPELTGGQNLWQVNQSQIGRQPSHFASKMDIRPNPRAGAANPLWRWKVHNYRWDPDRVGNADAENARNPEGITGLVADEVHATAPDAVTMDAFGKPASFDSFALLAYIVDALQYVEARLRAVEKRGS